LGTGVSRESSANADGYYVIPSLAPAQYSLTVHMSGFSDVKEEVTLLADQTLTVNFKLRIGGTTETVTVTSGGLEVDTTTSTLKQVIEQQRITELPLNGRNAATLTLLVPGALNSPNGGADQGSTKTFPGAVTISANGARQNMVSYQLDGGNYLDEYTNVNQPFPFPDALQEFSVQTSNYSAEYGQNAGAVVNVVTKSGTNELHGDAFEFLRNAVFNARNFFAPLTTKSPTGAIIPSKDMGRDQLKRNQFGGTIGGPIIHDKTFFFGGIQATRLRNLGNVSTSTVSSQADIGAFTAGGGVMDSTVANLLPLLPIQPTSRTVAFARPDHQDFYDGIGRVDQVFSPKDRLAVRYDFNYFSKAAVFVPTNILTYADGSKITNQNYLIHETHIFRPTLINDFRFSYAREKASRGPATTVPSVQTLGSLIPFQPKPNAIQQIRVNGFFSFGDNPAAAFVRNNFSWSNDVSWVKGKHDLRFGGVIERSRVDLDNLFFQPAEFSFSSLSNFLSGVLSDYSGNLGFRQGAGEFKNDRNIFPGLYAQDNYKVSRRLTLNFGLRYEPVLPWREIKGRVEQFRLSGLIAGVRSTQFPNAPPGLYFPGDPGVPQNGIDPNWKNFGPRVGFAYDVFGDGKTSLRGGAGMFYDTRMTGIINNRFVDVTPFSPQLILSTTGAKPGTLTDPLCTLASTQSRLGCTAQANLFPAVFPPPPSATFAPNLLAVSWDPNHNYQTPTIYDWNLAIERQLPSNVLVRAAYVGSHGDHIKETIAFNVFPVCGGPSQPSCTGLQPRLNAIAGKNVFGTTNNGPTQDSQDINSIYHSLQLSAEKRMTHGLTILGNYTYSKSIDDLPNGGGVADIGADTISPLPWDDPLRHQFDRGPSDFDHTHRFVASYVWQLPGLSGTNSFVHHVFGDWEWGGIVSAQTGRPFTVLSGVNASGTGIGQDRATLVGNPHGAGACAAAKITTVPCVDWLNPAAFQANAPGSFGNIGKGSFRLPNSFTWDMGLTKNFLFTERWRLQFRAEFFNVFNHANFMDDGASLTNFQKLSSKSNFGAIQEAADPRIGQLALKVFF
jgi:Carboxypeptidase regulatory-like domain/TonB dependent receptor